MKKINFTEVKVATSIKKDDFKVEDMRETLADAMYKNASKIGYMSLAMKIYNSKGEVELDEKETQLLKEFCQGFPLFVQDALGLIEVNK